MKEVYSILKELKNLGGKVSTQNGSFNVDITPGLLTPELINRIKDHKEELINFLDAGKNNAEMMNIDPTVIQESYPISDAQRRLWVICQFKETSIAYNIPGSINLNEDIDIDCFRKAVLAVIDRHEILRTVFHDDDNHELRQWVLNSDELNFEIDHKDFSNELNPKEIAKKYIRKDAVQEFDFVKGPLVRMAILKVSEKSYIFYYNLHHIISDGWSMDILSQDVMAYYNTYKQGIGVEPEPLRIQYKDYSAWQHERLNTDSFDAHRSYWLDKLKGELPVLDLPVNKQRPAVKSNKGHSLRSRLNVKTTELLINHANANGGSLFVSVLTIWNVLMYRYTSQKDIIIGTPLAGRDHHDLKNQIGFYVNTLPLRNKIDPEESFNDFYDRVKENTIECYNHQMYPFDRLVEDLDIMRDTRRNFIFDVLFTFQNKSDEENHNTSKLTDFEQIEDLGKCTSKYDLDIVFVEMREHISINLVFNPEVYEKEMVVGLIKHFKNLVQELFSNPTTSLAKIDFLDATEKQEILVNFNSSTIDYCVENPIINLFEKQVEKTPDAKALVFQNQVLTYRQLNEKANQFADFLRKNYNIQLGDLIGINLQRSPNLVVSILSTLKAGGTYVPIDPEYPQERIDFIKQDTDYKVCINLEKIAQFETSKTSYSAANTKITSDKNSLAYLIYTSGSTGQPKGVMVENQALANLCFWHKNNFGISVDDRASVYAGVAFDASVWEIFPYLISGASLYFIPTEIRLDIEKLNAFYEENQISISFLPTQIAERFFEIQNRSLRYLLVGGEKLNRFKKQTYTVVNNYGPTENTVVATSCIVSSELLNIPIGKPISNVQVYILNDYDQLVPVGVIGEVCLAGKSLARGYFKREDLTKESFVKNPFNPNERLYKTGDLGKWLADGSVVYVGRKDDQIKIRGYRIELGEIEHALLTHEVIDQAVVIARDSDTGSSELVAYLTASETQNVTDLHNYLKALLPQYMIPSYFVQLETLPLTPNGKIDKKMLPEPGGLGISSGVGYVAPQNQLEKKLVEIWKDVFEQENIGIYDDFFTLGGHSLNAMILISEYQEAFDVELTVNELFVHTTIEAHANLIDLSNQKALVKIERVVNQESYPISDGQRRLWVLSQFESSSAAYNIAQRISLNMEIDLKHFKKSIDATIERHEILRTVFTSEKDGEVRQVVIDMDEFSFEIDYQDYRNVLNKQDAVNEYIQKDTFKSFDLEKGPLLRATLLRMDDEEYVFYYNLHHIISDGWSMGILSRDVMAFYRLYSGGIATNLTEPRIQYRDYSVWQLKQLEGEKFQSHGRYWLKKLSGKLPLINLPSNKLRPRVVTHNGHELMTYLDQDITTYLKQFSTDNGGSLFMGLCAIWNVLMYRYTGQEDIILGTPVAGRDHPDLKEQIGFYVNTLVLKNSVQPTESFQSFFQRLKENTLESFDHQMYPFDRLIEDLNLQRDVSRNAVFDIMITLQNSDRERTLELEGKEINRVQEIGSINAKFDLDLTFVDQGNYISMDIIYNTDVYDRGNIEKVMKHFKQLSKSLLKNPEKEIIQSEYLSAQEKFEIHFTFNDTLVQYPEDKTIAGLFEEQVRKTPNQIAVVFEDVSLTFKELDEKANQLGHYLKDNYNIQPDDLVGIRLDRNEWMVICVLAVLKSGGAYVPIDLNYPQERIDFIEKDAACKLLLDQSELEKFIVSKNSYSKVAISSEANPNNLSYVIYTSGTTGQPKGVMVSNSNVSNSFYGWFDKYKLDSFTVNLLQMASMSFDVFMGDLCRSILTGGKAVICPMGALLNPEDLYLLIVKHNISILEGTPSVVQPLMDYIIDQEKSIDSLKMIIFGSDALNMATYSKLQKKFAGKIRIINSYGTTETTIDSSFYESENEPDAITGNTPIGKPFPNVSFLILDQYNKIVPVGVVGELCIGGKGVSKGYLNRPELTAEKFIDNPIYSGEKVYKTGDLGKWTSTGNVEFIGRKDDQVKIRGYRIELGEIEFSLLSKPEIESAVLIAHFNPNQEIELIAYITSKIEEKTNDLRNYLKKSLPDFMLPAYFVQLREMPLTANGKVNKKALPAPEGLSLASGMDYIAPESQIEKTVVEIWQKILNQDQIGLKDDFFALGGHSLKAIRLINEYQKKFEVKISISALFNHTTIEDHLKLIGYSKHNTFVEIEKVEEQESYPISDAQRRLWILSQFGNASVAYNMPHTEFLSGVFNILNLKKAVHATIQRHEILRTVFKENDEGELRQFILDSTELELEIEYIDYRADEEKEVKVRDFIETDSYAPFDLVSGPLLRAKLLQLEDDKYIFYYNIHHIISDGTSLLNLTHDVLEYYNALNENRAPELADLRIQYKDYSVWQLKQLESDSFKQQRKYWQNQLAGELPTINLPSTKQRPRQKTYNGRALGSLLNKQTSQKLKEYGLQNGGTLYMGLLASLNVIFHRYLGQNDFIIGSPLEGREHADLKDQIGFYANTLAFRNELNPHENFNDFYQKVKQNTLSAYANQMYPFDRLVEDLELRRDIGRSPIFDVMLVLINNGDDDPTLDLTEAGFKTGNEILDYGSKSSKFDFLISVEERAGQLNMIFEFNTDVYEQEMVEDFICHYQNLIAVLIDNPNVPIGEIDFMSTDEKDQLVNGYNKTGVVYENKTVIQLFEEQAKLHIGKIALEFDKGAELTYEELNHRANQLANHIINKVGSSLESMNIGVMLERSLESVIAMIGVMKTGACYVPIDHDFPSERVKYIAKDAGLNLIVSTPELLDKHDLQYSMLIDLNAFDSGKLETENPCREIELGQGAFIVYTSGSTGKPKGVIQTHRMMSNLIQWDINHSGITPGLKYLQYASFSFDASLHDIFFTLATGGISYIASQSKRIDLLQLKNEIVTREVEVLSMPYSALKALFLELDDTTFENHKIKYIVSTAEQLYISKGLQKFLEDNASVEIHNHYGPSETHVVTSHRMSALKGNIVRRSSIGKPISNTSIYLLDAFMNLVPIGAMGELYIGGSNLAIGYLNREDLTKEKFVNNPFKTDNILYKSGDIGRWLPDGTIELIGRKDDQVKIRGYRIELGEIEQAILSDGTIEQAVIVARESGESDIELVAYFTAHEIVKTSNLRSHLKEILPDYMIPPYFVQMDEMPLTPNGKVDKKNLPNPKELNLDSGKIYVAPRNDTEEKVVAIWELVLGREPIGVMDDFFELGGHSFRALGLIAEYKKSFSVVLTLPDLYERTILSEHAELIEIRNWMKTKNQSEALGQEEVETFDF